MPRRGPVVDDPAQRRGAVVEAGRERVRAVLAAAVAELDADDDQPAAASSSRQRPYAAPAASSSTMPPPCRCSTPGSRTLDAGRPVEVERDVVAVEALDDLDAPFDAGDRRHAGDDGGEQAPRSPPRPR